MEENLEIYYNDLSEGLKEEIKLRLGVKTDQEVIEKTNWDCIPLSIITV